MPVNCLMETGKYLQDKEYNKDYHYESENFYTPRIAGTKYCRLTHWVKDISPEYELYSFFKVFKDCFNSPSILEERRTLSIKELCEIEN